MNMLIKLALGQSLTEQELSQELLTLNSPDLVLKLARGQTLTDQDLSSELYEVCDSVHASCNDDCPVYKLNGSQVPDSANDFKINRGCDCFKSGSKMLQFIRDKSK